MPLSSPYDGHRIEPSFNFNITGKISGDIQGDINSVRGYLTYTFSDNTEASRENIFIELDNTERGWYPIPRPSQDKKVAKLQETITATFNNESSENKNGVISLRNRYGRNDDLFTYFITVTPPPPVCTTTLGSANIDLGKFTISRLKSLSPGQSLGVDKATQVFSECTYSAGANITMSTLDVTKEGYLSAGGGISFIPLIDGKEATFNQNGKFSFKVNSSVHKFDFGVTVVRSDEKPVAGVYKNIVTITTTPF